MRQSEARKSFGRRLQFGRAVGTFHAVQHKCTDIGIRVQAATAATYYAAMAVDERGDHARADSVAKVRASEGISRVAGEPFSFTAALAGRGNAIRTVISGSPIATHCFMAMQHIIESCVVHRWRPYAFDTTETCPDIQ
jgi:hypothetical protein